MISRWLRTVSAGLLLMGLATLAWLTSAKALNLEPTVLTAQQIKHMVTGTTLAGKVSEIPIRIFFDASGTFMLAVKKGGNAPQKLSGSWYVEPEADLLCLSIAAGDGGRQCWIVRRGDTIELNSSKGSLARLDVQLRTVSFDFQDVGSKMEFAEKMPTSPASTSVATDNFVIRQNRDIYGNDILMPDGQIGIAGLDLNQCASQCERVAACVAFSVDRWIGKCYLKNDVTTSILDARSTLAVKKPRELPRVSTAESEIKSVHRRRFRGELLVRRNMPDLKTCRASCETDIRCVGFTFQTLLGQSQNCDTFKMLEGYDADNTAEGGFKVQPPN
jgi:hypothetical protein